jgi:hypothetical protein
VKSPVAVEKPPPLKKQSRSRDRKCSPKSRMSFIGHSSAMKFPRTSRVWVFQQLRLFATATKLRRCNGKCSDGQ